MNANKNEFTTGGTCGALVFLCWLALILTGCCGVIGLLLTVTP